MKCQYQIPFQFPFQLTISLIVVVFSPPMLRRSIVKRDAADENDLEIYASDAKPYANLVYDKILPVIPRYRYSKNKDTNITGFMFQTI